eukprot:1697064-Rhodomonas_salina.2
MQKGLLAGNTYWHGPGYKFGGYVTDNTTSQDNWFQPELSTRHSGHIMVKRCWNSKGTQYLDCEVMEQVKYRGLKMVFPILEQQLSKNQIEKGD